MSHLPIKGMFPIAEMCPDEHLGPKVLSARAVDVTEVTKHMFMENLTTEKLEIGTEELESGAG